MELNDARNRAEPSLKHNYVFASVGPAKDDQKGPLRDCGKILDPWRNGLPDIFDPDDNWEYRWNYINTGQGKGSRWQSDRWVPDSFFLSDPTPPETSI